jgi:ComEC/Rec2-related protein
MGFLIGETRNIPVDIYRMFRDTGTLHVLAVSGSNVALVIGFVVLLLRPLRLRRPLRTASLLVVIVLFAGLSYGDPSVVRASVMATLVLLARLAQRRFDLNNIIALAALLLLIIQPAQLYDTGFQLSFVIAWGLIFVTPRIFELFKRHHARWWYRWLLFPVVVSIVAQICSAPLIAYHFERIPAVSVIANLFVVPLVAIAVIGVLVVLMADLILPLLGLFAGSLVDKLLLTVVWVLRQFGGEEIPVIELGGVLPDGYSVPLMLSVYVLIAMLILAIRQRVARRIAVVTAVLCVNVGIGCAVSESLMRETHIVSIHRVPGGVATLIGDGRSDPVDLVLTGLAGRSYPLDEKVFKPLISDLSRSGLRRLFILSGDYDAIDDILRVGRTFEAETVYAHPSLEASIRDVVSRDTCDEVELSIRYMHLCDCDDLDSGYCRDTRGLWLGNAGSRLLFTDQIRISHFTLPVGPGNPIIICGERWTASAADWIRLEVMGYSAIICSEIAQLREEAWMESDRDPDAALPAFIWDLNKRGPLRLCLDKAVEFGVD